MYQTIFESHSTVCKLKQDGCHLMRMHKTSDEVFPVSSEEASISTKTLPARGYLTAYEYCLLHIHYSIIGHYVLPVEFLHSTASDLSTPDVELIKQKNC